MNVVKNIFRPFIYVFKNKKKMVLFTLLASVIFAFLIFPYDDLADLLTEQVANATKGQGDLFLQFDELGLSLFPPSLKLTKVSVDSSTLPTIKAGELYLAPSIAGLLTFSPGFSASIVDFLKGSVNVDFRASRKTQKIGLSVDKIDLKGLSSFAQLPVDLEGRIQGQIDAEIDPSLVDQPSGQVTIRIEKLRLPNQTVPTPIGPQPIPETSFAVVVLKGTLKQGQFDIEDGTIGQNGDGVQGHVKGFMQVKMVGVNGQITPVIGRYELKLDLNLNPNAEKNFGLILSLCNGCKSSNGTTSHYNIKLAGTDAFNPPNITSF